MLDQQEFEHHPPRLNERRACGSDDHIISGRRGAGRRELAGCSLHLNQADPAGAEGMQFIVLAQGRNPRSGRVSSVQDGGPVRHLDLLSINRYRHFQHSFYLKPFLPQRSQRFEPDVSNLSCFFSASSVVKILFLIDRPEPARLDAGFALRALFRIDIGYLALFPNKRPGRAGLEALTAFLTLVLVHHELDEGSTDPVPDSGAP